MYYNEATVADLAVKEMSGFVNQLLVVEGNRTFQYGAKKYNFQHGNHPQVKYFPEDFDLLFQGKRLRRKQSWPFLTISIDAWSNERVQRNLVASKLQPADDDYVILGDIDEILDSRQWEEIVFYTNRHGIVTVGLHHTMYFVNLFATTSIGDPRIILTMFS